MTARENLAVAAYGSLGPAVLALYLLRAVSLDAALSVLGFSFTVALVPGVVENYRKKIGWSKKSCAMTGNNLLTFGVVFAMLGLTLTAISQFMTATMWTVLLVQAFMYAKPRPPFKLNLRLGTVDTAEEMEAVVRVLKHGHGEYYEERKDGCPTCEARDAILDRSVRDIGACDGCGME